MHSKSGILSGIINAVKFDNFDTISSATESLLTHSESFVRFVKRVMLDRSVVRPFTWWIHRVLNPVALSTGSNSLEVRTMSFMVRDTKLLQMLESGDGR